LNYQAKSIANKIIRPFYVFLLVSIDSGEIVCSKCGIVISDKIQDTRQEWRNFLNSEEDRRRIGVPTSLASHDTGLYTMIGRGRKDARGQVLDASMRSTMGRLTDACHLEELFSRFFRRL
jgi:transcription initiation factor TFIIIB Brf1 subunit/transcription initiation factor TFIIB